MPNITPNDIQNIRDFDTLLDFFRDKLGWHIPEDVELEDVAFPWSAEDLDLDDTADERIAECQQLPPFPPSQLTLWQEEETQPWGIFFLQFNDEHFYRTALRRVLRGLVERSNRDPNLPSWEHDQLLFICTTPNYQQFAFANFAANDNWRRSVLSIFSWEQGDTHIRTLCEYNLPALAYPSDGFSDDEAWLNAWKEAFDVEIVTDKFFTDYQRVFSRVEAAVEGIPDSLEEEKRLYTQRLFNRLMFLRFIEKKGWLTYNEDREYLRAMFDATEAETDENFLNDRLYWAFFNGLGTPGGSPNNIPEVVERRGEVPFLNGGLFEMQAHDERNAIDIPNEEFAEILHLFERYNFTVTESTPLDVEVAVDPEMLGKVFEELVTGRHDTGSYYTPRPVVSFMCRESLKICLQNKTDETEECLKKFVDDGDATEIRNPERVLEVLQTLRICDPACGSGAYLLGMMSELLRLRDALFQSNQIDSPTIYQRKLDIIQNNLYGVDKDEFAVNIAMLRLWLSLAVDYEGDTPQPLPNLDYKVAVGDSLTGPTPSTEQIGIAGPLIRQIQEHQADYLVTYINSERQRLREVISELEEQIQGWQENPEGFIWQVKFPEVFHEGGFDIVIGNPPYVRQELIRSIRPTLQRIFPDVYTGTADLYVYFYKRGGELLRDYGVLTYISSNKFLRSGYGRRLRTFLTDQTRIHILLDFGGVGVFRANVDTCIILVENNTPSSEPFLAITIRDEADIPRLPEVFQERAFSMHTSNLPSDVWVLTSPNAIALLTQLQNTGTQLNELIQGRFYFGIKTGCNDAFIVDAFTQERLIAAHPESRDLIKPLLRGRNLRKWQANSANEYLIVIPSSANTVWPWSNARNNSEAERVFAETYPVIYNHLNDYQDRLMARDDQGSFYWELRSCTYYDMFEKPKIIYPDISPLMRACYDTTQSYCLQTTYIIPTEDISLLAILNSQLFDWYARHKFQNLNDPWSGGGLRFIAQYMRNVPIADRTEEQRAALTELVERILGNPNSDQVREIEREIDEIVYQLYGLTEAEIALIKQTYRDAGMEV
ncbi:class I SAM-dependent DNA methyltransferase [Candidatus Poribacteria bacterium]|nr:class I SAM-dependent DNA methyltransferase [Candidatus Poribacteria bacterium]MYB66676.1 class I SAM-dependent DNA methyltransferase [Candidatus Poribacteria bacterium]